MDESGVGRVEGTSVSIGVPVGLKDGWDWVGTITPVGVIVTVGTWLLGDSVMAGAFVPVTNCEGTADVILGLALVTLPIGDGVAKKVGVLVGVKLMLGVALLLGNSTGGVFDKVGPVLGVALKLGRAGDAVDSVGT